MIKTYSAIWFKIDADEKICSFLDLRKFLNMYAKGDVMLVIKCRIMYYIYC